VKDAPIRLLCIAVLLVIGAAWLSTIGALHWNAEADGVLQNGLNASGVIETAPILNPGKPALPCPECAGYVLTDYRNSPSVYGPKGLYKGHFKGDRFVFDTPITMDNLFQKEPPKGSR